MLSLFPAYFDRPQKIRFSEQEPDEHIELFLRQHWVTNIGWLLTALIGFVAPLLIMKIDQLTGSKTLAVIPDKELIQFIVVWYMLLSAYVIEKFLYWYYNVYIVTSQNLVDVDFYSLLSRTVVEVDLKDIESQSSKIRGIMGSFFNFGDVHIESAAERQSIDFESVPNPDKVADRIQDLRERLGHGGGE